MNGDERTMPDIHRLDPVTVGLGGLNLIEASAGTGKTYTITGLYLRLVAERGIRVDRILVVTYTVAATAELKDRIRERLAQARRALDGGTVQDPFIAALVERLAPEKERVRRRLDNAMRGFDEAAVYTIHGFCKRVLADRAFASGMPFQTELLTDERELLQEVVDDFWRRHCYDAPPLAVAYLLKNQHSPEAWQQVIRPHLGKPYLELRGAEKEPGAGSPESDLNAAYEALRTTWPDGRIAIQNDIIQGDALNKNSYRPATVASWLTALENLLEATDPTLEARVAWLYDNVDILERLSSRLLKTKVKKNKTAPEHPFFDACEALFDAFCRLRDSQEHHARRLRLELLEYARRELDIRKRRLQVQSYDDLLLNLYRALRGRDGEALAELLRGRYQAALIDEFQDTDPVQYDNFRRIHGPDPDLPVFLVGDPKQAIYSFRGADIFAYLAARRDAARRHTLDTNWRSSPALIRAVNALFQAASRPFLFEAIPFIEARPAPKDRETLTEEGRQTPALRLWLCRREDDAAKPMPKGQAQQQAAQVTAAEIARLLNGAAQGQVMLGGQPLEGGHIAVLVRSHYQGQEMRRALLALGVPCVQQARDSVFASQEARELERLLLAVAEPGREPRIRAALATVLLGTPGEDLHALSRDETAWMLRLAAFHDYHRLWREHGFIRMFRGLLAREGIAPRLLALRDGERRLTNLLHLGELLAEAGQRRDGMEGLLKWLAERIQDPGSGENEAELRLESDENLVKIITVHKSKGLEYPVVFCPYIWDAKNDKPRDSFVFHDPEQDHKAVLDLGSPHREAMWELARRESLAEDLRLFYVAVTRARHRCYLLWGNINYAGHAAPAWLFHGAGQDDPAAVAERFKGLSDEQILAELNALVKACGEDAAVGPTPTRAGESYRPGAAPAMALSARHLTRPVSRGWSVTSFSGLTANLGAAAAEAAGVEPPEPGLAPELPDYDADPTPEEMVLLPRRDIFTFPRGARAGRCLHAIFEHLDFARAERAELEGLVGVQLAAHGFSGEDWQPVVADTVERVLATALDASGLCLGDVTQGQRLNELEFYYPLADLHPDGLCRLLHRHGFAVGAFREEIDNLSFSPARGYMKGYIDLIFESAGCYHLVDYKSNWLGDSLEDYGQDRLESVMARDAYWLQYLVYVVALHRYLRLRLADYDYDRHVGSVYYLFLRGMDPCQGPGYGVYRTRPDKALVQALDDYLERP